MSSKVVRIEVGDEEFHHIMHGRQTALVLAEGWVATGDIAMIALAGHEEWPKLDCRVTHVAKPLATDVEIVEIASIKRGMDW